MPPGISVPALPSASPTLAQFSSAANAEADSPAMNPAATVSFENLIGVFLLYSIEVALLCQSSWLKAPVFPVVCASRACSASAVKLRGHRRRNGQPPLGAAAGWSRTPLP